MQRRSMADFWRKLRRVRGQRTGRAFLPSGGVWLLLFSLATAQAPPLPEDTGPTGTEAEAAALPAFPAPAPAPAPAPGQGQGQVNDPAPLVAPRRGMLEEIKAALTSSGMNEDQRAIHRLWMWTGGATVVLLFSLLMLTRYRRANRPRLFPAVKPRTRFSAPHSGGNNAMISFGREKE